MKHNHAWKATEVAGISSALLKWYDTQRRCLPWRGDSTPYLVRVNERDTDYCAPNVVTPYGTWVSEIMCQQTRVDTVVAYYTKWMDTFPTVQSLAAADPDQVNAVWAGLGYDTSTAGAADSKVCVRQATRWNRGNISWRSGKLAVDDAVLAGRQLRFDSITWLTFL
ncbi:hypothetical protein DYB32_007214 [Aphanomyces invadans]|uniref:HhH-GPD domain-containing protein n=1 Tax=Aphanomyces invadans TaxID=157072 RepID=A0A418AQT8_9STRA|nr:hypothetical protein DYB32_007214 [Aphanomyces invadans]